MASSRLIGRRAATTILVICMLGMLSLPTNPARATTAPMAVNQLAAATASWAMFLSDLGTVEELGTTPLPLTDVVAAQALDLHGLFDDLRQDIAALAPQTSVSDLASAVDALDADGATPDDPDRTVTATPIDADGPGATDGIDLTITLSRTAPDTVALTDPTTLAGGPVTVTAEVPLTVTLTTTAKLRVEDENLATPAWILAGGDAPHIGLTASIDHDLVDAPAAIGVGDLIANGSVDLAAALDANLFDPDGNGRVAFLEVANDSTQIPGELIITPNQLVDLARSGTAAATATLTAAAASFPPAGTVSIAVTPAPTDLAVADPVVELSGSAADLAELDRFQDITSFDLVNGLVQYATLLRAAQTNPSVDLDLPLVDGRASDLFDLAADLAAFTDDRISAVPTGSDGDTTTDPDGDIPPPIATDFTTIGDLVDLLEAEDWTPEAIPVTYDAGQDRVTVGLHLAKTLDTDWVTFTVPTPPEGQEELQTGLPKIGDELRGETGLRGANPTSGNFRETKSAYDVTLPLIIDLKQATPVADVASTPVVEFEDPMPYQRFRVPLGSATPQITVTTLLQVRNLSAEGLIGFVPATIVGTDNASHYLLRQDDDENPTTTIRLHNGGTLTDTSPRIGEVLQKINGQPVLDPATRKATLEATLALRAHGADPADGLTATNGIVTIDRDISSTDGLVAPPHGATLDATATALKALDFDIAQPDGLLGRTLDTADSVAEALEDLSGSAATDIPFVGASAKDVLDKLVGLAGGLDTVRTGPTPPSLAALETALEGALTLGAAELTWDLEEVTGDGVADLIARFDIERASSPQAFPFLIDLGPLGEITADGLTAQVGAGLQLGIVVPLNGTIPAGFPTLLDSGGFDASASLDSDDLALNATLGPFDVALGHAANQAGKLHLGATVSGTQGTEAASSAVTPSAWISDLQLGVAGPAGGATCTSPITDVAAVTGVLGCLSAPVKVNGTFPSGGSDPTKDDVLTVQVDELPPAVPAVVAPAALTTMLDTVPLSFDSFDDGLASIKALIHAAMLASSFGSKLPFIGDDLAAGTELLAKLDAFLDDPVGALGLTPVETDTVEQFLYQSVRPAMAAKLAGLGVLRDSGYVAPSAGFAAYYAANDGTASENDIRVVPVCGASVCAPGDLMSDVDSVTFEAELGQGSRNPAAAGCTAGPGEPACPPATVAANFDLGLDGLPLKVTGGMEASAGWSIELGFGVDRTDGFFLLDNPVPSTGTPDDGDAATEARIGGRVSLQQVDNGPELSGRLGFFEVGLEDKPAGDDHVSSAAILAQLGLHSSDSPDTEPAATLPSPNSSGRLTLGDLLNGDLGDAIPSPTLDADVDLDLRLQTGVDAATGISELDDVVKLLPKIAADLSITWDLADPTSLDITFGAVGLDIASLFDTAVGELLRTLDRMTDPIDPIREFLFAPIPVISDLSRLFGGGDVTFVDLAEIFGNVNLELLKDVNDLIEFVKALADTGDGLIPIGSFTVPDAAATGSEKTPDQAQQLVTGASPGAPVAETLKDAITDQADRAKLDNLSSEGGDQADFSSPLLEDPTCVFQLLMGGDCGIIEYRPDPLEIRFEYEQDFGPFFGVLYVTIGGYAEARGELGFGFSTRGVRLLAEDLLAGGDPDFGDIPDIFLQSIYLTDLDRQGNDIAELSVKAGITAGGKISVLIAAAGVRGGIEASMALNWHDGGFGSPPNGQLDGKIYIDEAISKIATPLCLFDISGRLRAFLEVYAEFGVCPLCYEESFELAEIILLEFSSSCPNKAPDLAELVSDGNGGTDLRLNVGSLASARGDGWHGDDKKDEKFTVRQLTPKDTDGNATFSVSAFGHTQSTVNNDGTTVFKARRVVVLDAANGNDSFLFQGLKTGSQVGDSVEPNLDDNDDQALFEVPVWIDTLGTGDDVAKTGDADDDVDGGDDGDQIDLGAGDDDANGGAGDDIITGGTGDDDLYGGADNDTIDGGLGVDEIFGDAGHDRLLGGSDRYSKPGVVAEADGGDTIVGGTGNDTIDGGSGDDFLYGDEVLADDTAGAADNLGDNSEDDAGKDRITGHKGVDTVFGGNAADVIVGGYSETTQGDDISGDHLHGNGGDDQISGRNGSDDLWGGPGADTLDGEGGDDQVHGQDDGDPLVRGGAGDDDVFGGGGDDVVLGDDGDDDLTGDGDDAATDTTRMGSDTIDGGNGIDIALGDNGLVDDTTAPPARTPGPSEDVGVGDTIKGGPDADQLYGEGGADFLYGNDGHDLIHGNGGVDHAFGENNDDEIWGDADNDVLDGGPDADLIFGNAGSDKAYGQAGNDDILGGSQAAGATDEGDFLYGQAGEDRIYGDNATITGTGAARVITVLHAEAAGTFGDDVIDGGSGQDEGHGQDGTDTLYGGTEHDQLYGELGGDFLYGQDGPDVMFGDKGTTGSTPREVTVPAGGWSPGKPNGLTRVGQPTSVPCSSTLEWAAPTRSTAALATTMASAEPRTTRSTAAPTTTTSRATTAGTRSSATPRAAGPTTARTT